MKSTALCHGAATIVTAFATGRGAAYGIGLENRTTVELCGSGALESAVNGVDGVGLELADAAIRRVLARFKMEFTGAKVVTESNIPHAAGLKSSSVAANAIVLAAIGAVAAERGEVSGRRMSKTRSDQEIFVDGERILDEEIIDLGIDAAFDAHVTVTGALDDASAAYFGGYTLTENLKRTIVYRGGMEETLKVIILVPDGQIPSASISPGTVAPFAKEVDLVWEEARAGRVYQAITLNGLIHYAAFGQDNRPALKALGAGAIAAGLSGTGPATVALTRGDGAAIREAWEPFCGKILETVPNNKKARLIG